MKYTLIAVFIGVVFASVSFALQRQQGSGPTDIIDVVQDADIRANEVSIQRNNVMIERNTQAIVSLVADVREVRSTLDYMTGIVFGFGLAFTALQIFAVVLQWRAQGK
jgi:predicted butyrate kinase (DUF1464 family)